MLIKNIIAAVFVCGCLNARSEDTAATESLLKTWLAKEAVPVSPAPMLTFGATNPPVTPRPTAKEVKVHATLEYQLKPPPAQSPQPESSVMTPLPRVGTPAWIQQAAQRDRDLLAHWELRWLQSGSVIEDRPSLNDFTGAWR